MYLSRMRLNVHSPLARREIHDCHALHQRIMLAFPVNGPTPRRMSGALYRLDSTLDSGDIWLHVQSQVEPRWHELPEHYAVPGTVEVKRVDAAYAALRHGMRLAFRLRANPTRKVDTRSTLMGERRNGRRVAVRGEEGCLTWLSRKGNSGGFEVLDVTVIRERPQIGKRSDDEHGTRTLTFAAAVFTGVLRVTDADQFRETLTTGVGSGKAYGFGLLSVAPTHHV